MERIVDLRRLFVGLLCLSLIAPAIAFAANRYALLVGVSTYPTLSAARQLPGAANDVDLMRQVLLARGFEARRITVLAELPDADGAPTRESILSSLEQLSRQVSDGDYVYFHFSGHGSQQPAAPGSPDEPDGLDEILLPRDIGSWDGSIGRVRNAIVDDEIGARLQAIRRRGAFVWAVIDTCHAATATRGAEDDGATTRSVPAAELGIPASAFVPQMSGQKRAAGRAEGRPVQADPHRARDFGLVGFYAVQSDEDALELRLPRDRPARRPQGLFTYSLARIITQHPNASYRQAADLVLRQYAAEGRQVTPMFEGGRLLDAPMFGAQQDAVLREWKVFSVSGNLTIRAGTIDGLAEGSIFSVSPGPESKDPAQLGYVRVAEAGLTQSRVLPVPYAGHSVLPAAMIPAGAVARLVRQRPDLRLSIALRDKHSAAAAGLARTSIAQQLAGHISITWVDDREPADISIILNDTSARLYPALAGRPAGLGRQGIDEGIEIPGDPATLGARLEPSLIRVAQVNRLLAAASQIPGGVSAQVSVRRRNKSATELIAATGSGQVRNGDQLELVLRNNRSVAGDFTVLYIDSAFQVRAIYPDPAGSANRLAPGDEISLPIAVSPTRGGQRLVILGADAIGGALMTDFSFLEQRGIEVAQLNGRKDRRTARASSPIDEGIAMEGEPFPRVASPTHAAIFAWQVLSSRAF